MRRIALLAFAAIGLALALPSAAAEAKGCIKGAIAGGVAGHYAGHHGFLGAVSGCIAGRQAAPTCASDNGKRSIDFTVLQGNSAIEMILVSNDARHFFVGRHAPIWREMINESRQVVA